MQVSLRGYLTRLRREFPFDVILASWAYPDGVAAAHLAAHLGCPLVTMILGSDLNALARDPALRPQIQWGLGRAQHVITVSAALRERVIELGISADKVIVQHNGVDGAQFTIRDRAAVRAQLGLPAASPLLCYVGNFKSEKGVDVLVEAMGHLRRCGREDVELALIGSGPLESKLRTRVQELHLESQVRFCGRRGHAEIPDWISAADALCLPSHREGCPNVILEALASGRPVVASRVGGVPELLDERSGVMVPPGDPEALAQGLASVLARQWEPEALRACVEFPSWDQYGLVLRDALTSAIHAYRAGEQKPEAVLI
jgi:glycosyltransferase involved in cell wall biosynthesis